MKNIFLVILFTFIATVLFAQTDYKNFVEEGKASFYSNKFEGKTTASGVKFRQSKLTAAHPQLPFGTMVKVTNKENRKTVIVEINDRGPFVDGRIIDLSRAAAEELEFIQQGVTRVKIEVVEAHDPKDNKYKHNMPSRKDVDVSESVFYKLQVEVADTKGFGVQIGLYEESANLLGVVEHLKKAYKKHVTVVVTKIRDARVYKVIIGHYKDRDHAQQLQTELQATYPDCFVIDFSNQ